MHTESLGNCVHTYIHNPHLNTMIFKAIAMFLVTSPVVINVPTRGLLAVETMHAIVRWLANLNIKRTMTSMFVNKKHRYKSLWDRVFKN